MTKAEAYRIKWQPKAREDLRAIVRYIGKDNPGRARSFGQTLHDTILRLAQYPKIGYTGRPGLPVFVRELVAYRNYIVFYRIQDEAYTVEILRVKYVAQQTP
jgi:plasmid stabilization system protein ParE